MLHLIQSGITGLRAAQRGLETAGHNVANVNTEGYSRQRVEQANANPQYQLGQWVGSGVDVAQIGRVYDDFLNQQVRHASQRHSELETVAQWSGQVDDLFNDQGNGLSSSLSTFFDGVSELSRNPSLPAARSEFLAGAEGLASQLRGLHSQLDSLRSGVNDTIARDVETINGLASQIAQLNAEIGAASARGDSPNDLLDQRDQALTALSERIGIETVVQDGGAVTVMVGGGHALVAGQQAATLAALPDPNDPQSSIITLQGGPKSQPIDITARLSGGSLGGELSFRSQVLDQAQNQLGLLAVGLADGVNALHRQGIDARGAPGGDLFQVQEPAVIAASDNGGDGAINVQRLDAAALTGSDYRLRFEGGAYSLQRLTDGATVAQGNLPLEADGLRVELTGGAPAANDQFLIQPTRQGAKEFAVAINDPRRLAAALPILATPAAANASSAEVSATAILDPSDPNLTQAVDVVFTGPATFDLIDPSSNATLASGLTMTANQVSANGWQLTLDAPPQSGDRLAVRQNLGVAGDNRNATALAALVSQPVADGRSAHGFAAQLIGDVGARLSQTRSALEGQALVLDQAQASRSSVSGVNLDEEAADLLRYRQAYEAAAQVIATANATFDTILGVVRS